MTTKEIVQFEIAILVYSVAFNYFLFGGSGIMLNKSEQGKKGSSSRLYIDKHTVFTNFITQEEFYMGKNLFKNEIIGCSISADVKIIWSRT